VRVLNRHIPGRVQHLHGAVLCVVLSQHLSVTRLTTEGMLSIHWAIEIGGTNEICRPGEWLT